MVFKICDYSNVISIFNFSFHRFIVSIRIYASLNDLRSRLRFLRHLHPPARWNDCKGLAPLAEEPTDFSVRSPSLASPVCSETRFWSGLHWGSAPAKAPVFSFPSDIDSHWILFSTWTVVRRWRPFWVSSLPAKCSYCSANVSLVLCAVLKRQSINLQTFVI